MDPKDRRSFIALLSIASIDNFGFAIIFVMFAPLFLSPEYPFFPADTSIATRNFYLALLFAAYPLTQFFGAPLLGDIADRFGRKKALILAVLGVIVGFILSGLACLLYSAVFLIITRLITGLFAGNLSICLSGIADISPTEKIRARNFGILATVFAVSWNIAMIVGGYLSDPEKSKWLNPAVPFWLTAALSLISFLILAKYYSETHPRQDEHHFDLLKGIHNIGKSLKIRQVRPFILGLFFWSIGWGLGVQWYGSYSILSFNTSQQLISWGLFIQGIFWAAGGSLLNPFLVKRYTSHAIALVGFILTALFLFAASFPSDFWSFNLFYWPSSLFCAFAFSNIMNLASINAPANVQGKIMGISQSVMSLAWIITPIFGGVAGSTYVWLYYPLSSVLIILAALVLLIRWIKVNRKNIKDF